MSRKGKKWEVRKGILEANQKEEDSGALDLPVGWRRSSCMCRNLRASTTASVRLKLKDVSVEELAGMGEELGPLYAHW